MLTRRYIEAILTDSKLADEVWELWNAGLIPDVLAAIDWWAIAKKLETKLWRFVSGRILFTKKGAS